MNEIMDYPRPQFRRKKWISLNGEWEFAFDDQQHGDREKWHLGHKALHQRINVPFCFQSKLSGIGDTSVHDTVWYRKLFQVPEEFQDRIILHFGAVDYQAWIYVNGQLAVTHEGGHTPFWADITDYLRHDQHEQVLVVKVKDYSRDLTLPRGKQYWLEKSEKIWYTRTTGIWQTVWLECVSPIHLQKVKMTPCIDRNEIQMDMYIHGRAQLHDQDQLTVQVVIRFEGETVCNDCYHIYNDRECKTIQLHDFNNHDMGRWWTPETPNLYDVTFRLYVNGQLCDEVESYFGMRHISVENGKLCLNHRPYALRMVLDQGYFPDGILTAPNGEALKRDVELIKEMGFNGVRKHQKIEDPRYLYWCDRLGLLVSAEMPNAADFSATYVQRVIREWQEVIERDYNHPSIIIWVPLNESWGVPKIKWDRVQQAHAQCMYFLTKSLDSTRLVVSNDGWEMVNTDLCCIHDYEWQSEELLQRYQSLDNIFSSVYSGRQVYVQPHQYEGEPVLVTECGGIAFRANENEGWGYSDAVSETDFLQRLENILKPLQTSPVVQGFCYTQFTDVEQEMNGLLTFHRQPKVPLEKIRQIVNPSSVRT